MTAAERTSAAGLTVGQRIYVMPSPLRARPGEITPVRPSEVRKKSIVATVTAVHRRSKWGVFVETDHGPMDLLPQVMIALVPDPS